MSNKIRDTMRQFAETYAKKTNTYFCFDKTVTAHVLEGLTQNKIDFGSPLCPCRYYDNKQEEVNSSYWNCPCVPMRERKECHCMLFLTEDDEFFSKSQEISFEELTSYIKM